MGQNTRANCRPVVRQWASGLATLIDRVTVGVPRDVAAFTFGHFGGLALRPESLLGKQTLCQLSYSRSEQSEL